MTFTGFSSDAFAFFEGLAADNSKAYWQAHKPTYDTAVKGALQELLADLGDYGPFHIFRPYNDVRFAKGRPPYKEQIAALGESQGGAIFYVQLSAKGMTAGTGYFHLASDQLERFRAAVDSGRTGPRLAEIAGGLEKSGYRLGGIGELKTAPRGFPKDHPRIELLRRKGLAAMREWERAKWMGTKVVGDRVRDAWVGAAAMNAWLDRHVGPSTLAPEERDFGR